MVRASSVLENEISTRNGWSSEGRRTAASAKLNLIKRAGSDRALSATAHQVLSLMVNWADTTGMISRKSVNYIAAAVNRDRGTVIRALHQITERGYLERIGRHNDTGNGPNDYRLCFDTKAMLRANAREMKRRQGDKKRSPHHKRRDNASLAAPNESPASADSIADATVKVSPKTPSESHECDTSNPYSSLSLPYGAESENLNTPQLNTDNQENGSIGTILSSACTDRTSESHSRVTGFDGNVHASLDTSYQVATKEERAAYFGERDETKREEEHRRKCQSKINTLITENNGWELLSKEELETAYKSEIEAHGRGVEYVQSLLGHRGELPTKLAAEYF